MNRLFASVAALLLIAAGPAQSAETITPAVGLAIHGQPKYPANFTHFSYVNPAAPKGGELRAYGLGTFDSLNPFIIKGVTPAAPGVADVMGMTFDTLMAPAADEPDSEYGLIAESAEVPADRSWVIFNLRKEAHFNDGSPVTADDVVFSFNILRTKGAPFYRAYYHAVTKVEKLDDHKVRFTFAAGNNNELPSILGQLPVLSSAYWQKHPFDQTSLDAPLGSGPYKVAKVDPGRSITLARVPDYWGKDLPVNVGMYNFDSIRVDYYRDSTVALEAFKAGAYDVRNENQAKNWATGYNFPAVKNGAVKLDRILNKRPTGMQAFVFNLRRPLFQDARVRRALDLAFDFEWTNKTLFYGQYQRTESYFSNSDMASAGLPSAAELKLLEPLKDQIPADVFTKPHAVPKTDGSGNDRDNLLAAAQLLKDAGWVVKDDQLVDASGKPFTFEILLDQPVWEGISLPFVGNLARLGIKASIRTVDPSQYENRVRAFNYDMVVGAWGESDSPGNEQREFWGSAAADQPGSRNLIGIKNKAVDALIDDIVQAPDRDALITATRALDRVLLWNEYVIPHWHLSFDRVAYWDKFKMPDLVPDQGVQFMTWWIDPAKAAKIAPLQKN
jgi:microcin C transport system substrate-binding protein